MYVEKSICDLDNKLVIRHETLKKIRHRVEIIRQIYDSPTIYCRALVEVVRRRRFSQRYLLVTILFTYLLCWFCPVFFVTIVLTYYVLYKILSSVLLFIVASWWVVPVSLTLSLLVWSVSVLMCVEC